MVKMRSCSCRRVCTAITRELWLDGQASMVTAQETHLSKPLGRLREVLPIAGCHVGWQQPSRLMYGHPDLAFEAIGQEPCQPAMLRACCRSAHLSAQQALAALSWLVLCSLESPPALGVPTGYQSAYTTVSNPSAATGRSS